MDPRFQEAASKLADAYLQASDEEKARIREELQKLLDLPRHQITRSTQLTGDVLWHLSECSCGLTFPITTSLKQSYERAEAHLSGEDAP